MKEQHTRNYRGGTISGHSAEAVDEALRDLQERDAKEERRRERWGENNLESMARLVASFPTLRRSLGGVLIDGLGEWNANVFLTWACGPEPGSGARDAARFVLSVWNSSTDWDAAARDLRLLKRGQRLGRFEAVKAISNWDAEHLAAFIAWTELPFWP
jgi:hypothetical protein